MIKKLVFFIFVGLCITLHAQTVNRIEIVVNDEPITKLDIDKAMHIFQVDKEQATMMLIQQKIILLTCKKYNIKASPNDVEEQLQIIARKNNLANVEQLKMAIEQQGGKIDELKETIEFEIAKQMLFGMIASNVKDPTNEQIQAYKNKHDASDDEIFNILKNEKIELEIKSFLEKEQLKANIKTLK